MRPGWSPIRIASRPRRPLRIRLVREAGGLGDIVCCLSALAWLEENFSRNGLTEKAVHRVDPLGRLGLSVGEPCELCVRGLGQYRALWEMSDVRFTWQSSEGGRESRRPRWISPTEHYDEDPDEYLLTLDLWCPFWPHEIDRRAGYPKLSRLQIAARLAGAREEETAPPRLVPDLASADWARQWLRLNNHHSEPLVLIYPLCHGPARIWPVDRWAGVAETLWRERGCRVVVCAARAREIAWWARHAPYFARVSNLRDPGAHLGWQRMTALIAAADLVLCSDTGPYHIAGAVKTPAVGVFGMTSGEITSRHYPLARWVQGGRGRLVRSDADVRCAAPCYHRWHDGFGGDLCKSEGCASLMRIRPADVLREAFVVLAERKVAHAV